MTTRQSWQRSITDDQGNLLTGVQISVFQQDGTTPATIYSGLTDAAMANPFNTGVQTVARFYAEPGLYVIRAFKAGVGTQEWVNVDISGFSVRQDVTPTVRRQAPRVAILGDSYAETQNYPPLGNTTSFSLYRFVLGGLGRAVDVLVNSGVSGNRYDQMLPRVASVIAPTRPDWVFLNGGVNDIFGAGLTAADTMANAEAVINQCLLTGARVVVFNCPPQVSTRSGFNAVKSGECTKFNRALADFCSQTDGVFLVDIFSPFVDFSNVDGAANPIFFAGDGIHLSTLGEVRAASAFFESVGRLFSTDTSVIRTQADTGIAGTRGLFVGTGGTHGAGSSGPVAAGFASSRVSGAGTIICSKLPGRGQRQSITLGATNGEMKTRLEGSLLAALAPFIGKVVSTRVAFAIKVASGGAVLKDIVVKLTTFADSQLVQAVNGGPLGGFPPVTDATFDTGVQLVTLRPLLVPAGLAAGTAVYFETLLDSVAGGVVELDIIAFEINEVP